MFQRVAQYGMITGGDGIVYRPRAYAQPRTDGTWAGFLVFFPARVGSPVVSTDEQTVQPTISAVAAWAATLTDAALHDGLALALSLEPSAALASKLVGLEADADALETAADVAGTASRIADDAAILHESDAAVARAESRALAEDESRLREEAATVTETEARARAELHERAAENAREVAADASRKRKAAAAPRRDRKTGGTSNSKKAE